MNHMGLNPLLALYSSIGLLTIHFVIMLEGHHAQRGYVLHLDSLEFYFVNMDLNLSTRMKVFELDIEAPPVIAL